MTDPRYDVVVIGSGPGGYVCAIRAAQLGLSVACIEKSPTFGGTCLNVGCIPSKALLESSELFHRANKEFSRHGIRVEPTLDLATMMGRKDKIVRQLTRGIGGLFEKNGVTGYQGLGRFRSPTEVEVVADDGSVETTLQAGAVVVATGSSPATLPGVELDGERIVSSTEALSFDHPPDHLVVIGAGVIGLELGSVWARLGSRVTVLEYMDRILPGADEELSKQAMRSFRRLGIKFELGVRVTAAEADEAAATVHYEAAQGPGSLSGDRVLVAVGRQPHTSGLNAQAAGVDLDDRGRVVIDSSFKTRAPGVYAIGDVVRGPQLAHKAEEEGIAVAELLSGGAGHVAYECIPSVVYTHPELAWVGKTEEELVSEGVEIRVGRFPFTANGRARAMESAEGMVKLIADAETDRLLGAHILGPVAGELIGELGLALEFGASAEDIARTCHAHPTLSEAIREAALDAGGRILHL